jgi:hypothetical protein
MRQDTGFEIVLLAIAGKDGGEAVPRLNPVRAVSSLIPEPGPMRTYALATIINMYGTGLLLVSMPLYFTRIVHLSAGQVGLGLTIAATITLLVGLLSVTSPTGTARWKWPRSCCSCNAGRRSHSSSFAISPAS